MPRSVWDGSISFGLVNIPVKIYPATHSQGLALHYLCKHCKTPLEYKKWCPKCQKEIPWKDVIRGYKISKDKWIVISPKDLEKIKLKTTKTIDIKAFVRVSDIDPVYYEKTYYVVPQDTGIKAYSLFVEALRLTGRAALGKIVMRNKEYLVALRHYKRGIAMHILYYTGEIQNIDELPELKHLMSISKEELRLAEALISQLSRHPKFEEFRDRYTEALKELIQAKLEKRKFKLQEEPEEKGKELLEALRLSVERAKKGRK